MCKPKAAGNQTEVSTCLPLPHRDTRHSRVQYVKEYRENTQHLLPLAKTLARATNTYSTCICKYTSLYIKFKLYLNFTKRLTCNFKYKNIMFYSQCELLPIKLFKFI